VTIDVVAGIGNVTLAASLPAPQVPSTSVTFTAAASGGVGPYQYKWWLFDGTTWTAVQSWSPAATLTWTPTVPAGYTITVWARSAGNTADAAEKSAGTMYAIQPAITGVTLSASQPTPQRVGTTVTFTAAASGGVGPYQYKWWLFDGTTWTAAQAWSTAATFTWTPTVSAGYTVSVWARSAGNSADAAEKSAGTLYSIVATGSVTSVTLGASRPAPQVPGTTVTFTATASGGFAPYEYKWWLFDGTVWTVVQGWSATATFTWTPMVANGNYTISVWARSAGNPIDAPEKSAGTVYAILGTSISGLTLGVDHPTPQPAGTAVTFTAAASGGLAPYQYKWWLFDGTTWTVAQNWSTTPTFTWTPTVANPGYTISVWVRSASNTADAPEKSAGTIYAIGF
jgi:hypothetical protein